MIKAFIKFNKGILASPIRVKLWLVILIFFNLVAPLFFIQYIEAQVAIASFIASMMFMTILNHFAGFTRILGLGHIFWIPLNYFLWTRIDHYPSESIFTIWIQTLIILNTISLVLDVQDGIRYASGDRKETVNVNSDPSGRS